MNGCGCWCFECSNRYAGWHCHGLLCEDGKTADEVSAMREARGLRPAQKEQQP